MEDYLEPSIEDYARFHGLTRNHLQPHPLHYINEASDVWQQVQDSSDIFQITPENATLPVERLAIGPEAASFLTSIGPQTYKGLPSPLSESSQIDTHQRRHLKQELPLLRRDPDHDLWLFARRIEPDLANEFLPCEALDEEADEALTWPSQTHLLPDTQWTKACSEKLAVSVDDLLYLQKSLKWHTDGGEHKTFQEDEEILRCQKAFKPISPPLLPASPEMSPHEPSPDTCHIELLSEATDSIGGEQNTIEESIFGDEVGSHDLGNRELGPVVSQTSSQPRKSPDDLSSPLKYIQDPGSSSPMIRKSMAQSKVEVPLSPPWSAQTPWTRKHASFTDAMSEAMGGQPVLIPASSSGGEDDIDTFFGSTIAPIATSAERSIEQEQLMEADTTLRVKVPVMDLSKPKPPWDNLYDSSLEVLKMLQINEIAEPKKHLWKPNGKAERELSWVPFPATLAAVNLGDITDDGATSAFLDSSDHLNSEDLVWKQDGLRILDDLQDSDEEDLEEGTFPDGSDLLSLVRKRRSMIDEDSELKPYSHPPKRLQQASSSSSTKALDQKRPSGAISPESRLLRSDIGAHARASSRIPEQIHFTALGALDNFIRMRNGTSGPLAGNSLNFFGTSRQATLQNSSPVIRPPSLGLAEARENGDNMEKNLALSSPTIQIPEDKRQFMMSTAFLSHRGLVHRMLELYPTANIIERESNLQSPAEKSPDDTLDFDADIIVSSGTGILLTSLQKIKQRALPGQASRSEVRDRISITAPRYEQLILIVRHDQTHGDDMTQNDCEALAEFVGFCSSISSTDILVKLIPGAEDHLAKWIVALMVEHSHPDGNDLLVLEETPWELFLRHAGLNAFAAQLILNVLRASSTDERMSGQDALTAFLRMGLEEKVARFEGMLGGRRALTRTHHILEARW